MNHPSPLFLRWWRLQREATVAAGVCREDGCPRLECPTCRRWIDIDNLARESPLLEGDRQLFDSYNAFVWAFRDRLEAIWRRA